MKQSEAKLVIVGGFGSGKTTLVEKVSEISTLITDEVLTEASSPVDDLDNLPDKNATTVSMDWGRRTIDDIRLYLFGFPGQHRFHHNWDELARGAVGAIILVDTRRIRDCWHPLEFVENRKLPHIVALNQFPDAQYYPRSHIRAKLLLDSHVPIMRCDVRQQASAIDVVTSLLSHVIEIHTTT